MSEVGDASESVGETRREIERRRMLDVQASLRKRLDAAVVELARQDDYVQRVEALHRAKVTVPRWAGEVPKQADRGVIVAMLSDLHLDEVVRPEEIGGINSYDRATAEQRLRSWAEQVAALPDAGPKFTASGFVVLWGGDMLNGNLRAEDAETNEDTVLGSVVHWCGLLAAALDVLAAVLPVHVVCVVGNHGRMTNKPRAKLRARDNLDWHLAHMTARLTGEQVTWQIDDDPDAVFTVAGHRHVLTHGDQARGGSGIGGIWPPIKRMVARKIGRYSALGTPVSHVWMGHWHQAIFGDEFTVNGSLKGYDEYASLNNFHPEAPGQVVSYAGADGITWRTVILV